MGCLEVIDSILVLYMALIAIGAPTLDAQVVLPVELYPEFFVEFKLWYIRTLGDYLYEEKPSFFVGIIWLELLFSWPLVIASIYGILARKAWFPTTLLISGVSIFTTLVVIFADMVLSKKASNMLLFGYGTVAAFSVLAILRALVALCVPAKFNTVGAGARRKYCLNDKKKA